ncbi:hypothetical protein HDU78_010612 [Chytriomyces hyalinus]|nr:hypothetical protein HDU78_010612 [Chytriomyces hyalinus]
MAGTFLLSVSQHSHFKTMGKSPPPLKVQHQHHSTEQDAFEAFTESLTCPINLQPFHDPVTAQDGYTYERDAIEAWFAAKKHATSPFTRETLGSRKLIPSVGMRRVMAAFEPVKATHLHSLSRVRETQEALARLERENRELSRKLELSRRKGGDLDRVRNLVSLFGKSEKRITKKQFIADMERLLK